MKNTKVTKKYKNQKTYKNTENTDTGQLCRLLSTIDVKKSIMTVKSTILENG